MRRLLVVAAGWLLVALAANACTVFLLTDGKQVLFCNNEDWINPNTRVWFVPAGPDHFGAVYVGFDNGLCQGGMNTEGLAFDAVAGYKEIWEPPADQKPVRGLSTQRMLETCATVDAAIAFYQAHREPALRYGKIFVADRSGASVIIGAKDGQLDFRRSTTNQGFGYGRRTLAEALAKSPAATVPDGLALLKACRQQGKAATKYSNIFDLRTGDIVIVHPPATGPVTLNLTAELEKGAHDYDIPALADQLPGPLRPLSPRMQRFYLDRFPPIADADPAMTNRLMGAIHNVIDGTMRAEDYNANAWPDVRARLEQTRQELFVHLGELSGMKLAECRADQGRRTYRYRLEFQSATVLHCFVLDAEDKIVASTWEALETRN